jgi:hypothetical protein
MIVEYKFKKGRHRSTLSFLPVLFAEAEEQEIKFKVSKWCDCSGDIQHEEQQNKIFGYSHGIDHHINSDRTTFSWGKFEDTIDVYKYYYISGNRQKPIYQGTYMVGEWIKTTIQKPKFGYGLFPYHGGEAAAPFDYSIFIDYGEGKTPIKFI